MNKNSSILRNYLYNTLYEVLILIIPFITTPYLSRVLGADNIGIYSYTLSITTYFILIGSIGIATYGKREIAYLRNNKKETSKVFFEIIILRFTTIILSTIIFYFSFIKNNEYSIYYKIFLLEILSTCFDITWFFQGLEDFKKITVRNFIVKILSVIAVFIFVKTSNDLYKYILIYVLSNLIGNILLWFYLPKYISIFDFKLNIFKHLKASIILFIPQIAIKIYTVLDKAMLGNILDDMSEVGYYEQSQKIVKMLLAVVISLSAVMAPRIAFYYKNKKNEEIQKFMHNAFNYVYFLSIPIIFTLISISDIFVPIFFGDGFNKVSGLIIIMSPIILLIGLSNIIGIGYLLPTKQEKILTLSVTLGALTNVILNLLLIKSLWSIGAAIATVIAETVVTIVQIYCIRKQISYKSIIGKSKKYLISGIFMLTINFVINLLIKNTTMSIILQIIFGNLLYLISLTIMKDEFLQLILKK